MTTSKINILTLQPYHCPSAPENFENVTIHSTQNSLPFAVASLVMPMIHPTPPQMPRTYCFVIPVTFQAPPPPIPANPLQFKNAEPSLMTIVFDYDEERALFNSYLYERKEKQALQLLQIKLQVNPTKYPKLIAKLPDLFPTAGYSISLLDLLITLQPSNPVPTLFKGVAFIKEHQYLEGISQIKEGFAKNPTNETIEFLLCLVKKLQSSAFQLKPELVGAISESNQALLRGIFLSTQKAFDRADRCLQVAFSDFSTRPLAHMLQLRNEWVNRSSQPVLPSRSAEEAAELVCGIEQGSCHTSSHG